MGQLLAERHLAKQQASQASRALQVTSHRLDCARRERGAGRRRVRRCNCLAQGARLNGVAQWRAWTDEGQRRRWLSGQLQTAQLDSM